MTKTGELPNFLMQAFQHVEYHPLKTIALGHGGSTQVDALDARDLIIT